MGSQILLPVLLLMCALVRPGHGLSCYTCHHWDTTGSDTSTYQVRQFLEREKQGNNMRCLPQGTNFVNNQASSAQHCFLQDPNSIMKCLSFKGTITMKFNGRNVKLEGAVRKCIEIPRRYADRLSREAYHCTKDDRAVQALYNNRTHHQLSMINAVGDFCGCNTTNCNTGEVTVHAHDQDHQHHADDHDHHEGDGHDHTHHHELDGKGVGCCPVPHMLLVISLIVMSITLGIVGKL